MTAAEFKFKLNDLVERVSSGEAGHVKDRGKDAAGKNRYLVRYLAADGTQAEDWWSEDDIRS
nr:hypothetical protein [uncultured Shinella sp.]